MKRMIQTLALTGLTGLAATGAFAGNAGQSLPACINHVINACNENSAHPDACSEAGINACEEYHQAAHVPLDDFQVKIQEFGNGEYKVSLSNQSRPKARATATTSSRFSRDAVPTRSTRTVER